MLDEQERERRRLLKNERQKAYYERNKDKVAAANRAWADANPDKVLAKQRAYVERNKERVLESKRAYNAKYSSENATYCREYKKKNAAAIAEYNKQYRRNNPDAVRNALQRWRASNKDRTLIHATNRKARKSGGRLSNDIAARLMQAQRGACPCCRADLSTTGHHLDHIMPLALGGTNTDDNVQLLCPPCNLSKHAKHPVDFMQQRGYLL